MRNLMLCVCIVLIFCVLAASPVLAIGLGGYGNYSAGQSYWDFKNSGGTDERHSYYGGGLLFDTAVAGDRLFHYRLGIGYDKIVHDSYSDFGDLRLNRIVISNTFGFGIVRSEEARLWLGPQFRVSENWGEDRYSGVWYDLYFGRGAFTEKDNYDFFRADLALVFGANLHLPGKISLGLEFGPRVFYGWGEVRISRDTVYSSFPVQTPLRESGKDRIDSIYGYEGFINVCAMIRINDEYKYTVLSPQ